MNKKMMVRLFIMMLFIVLALVGCGNKEEEKNEADKERLEEIALEIEALYNEEQDDLAEDVDEQMIEDAFELLKEVDSLEEDLSEENEEYFDELKKLHGEAVEMFNFETLVIGLVDEDGEVDEAELETVKGQLRVFEQKETFFNRMDENINEMIEVLEAKFALEKQIEETDKAFSKLYKKDKLKKDVSKDDYKKMKKLVKAIDDKDASVEFEKRLKKLDKDIKAVAKKEEEKRLAKEKEKEEEAKRLAEAKEQQKQQQSSQSSNTNQSNKSNNQTASKNSGGKSTASNNNQSKPKEQPKKKEQKLERIDPLGNSGVEFDDPDVAIQWAEDNFQSWLDDGYLGWKTRTVRYGYKDNGNTIYDPNFKYTVVYFKSSN